MAREGEAVQEAPAELEAMEVEAVLAVPAVQGEGEVPGAQAAVAAGARAAPVAVEGAVAAVEEAVEAAVGEAVAVAVGVSGS